MFCFFHNCMWQSWYSEVNVELLHLYGSLRSCLIFFNFRRCQFATFCGFWSTYGSPRTCWVLDVLVIKQRYLSRFPLWTLAHLRVSPFLIIGFLVLVGFVGYLWCFQRLLSPIHSTNYLCRKSSVVVEVTQIPSGKWFLQISSQLLSRYNKLGVYRGGGCGTSCLIEFQSFPLGKLYIDPIHRILVSFPLLLARCKTWFGQIKLLRMPVILIHGIHGRKEYRLSFPAWILSSRYQSWICGGVKLTAHPIW